MGRGTFRLFALLFSGLAWGAGAPIVGGTVVPLGDPVAASTVALVWDDVTVCTGTILGDDLVLTAAHCLGDPREIAFGTSSVEPTGTRRKITAAIAHPDFDLENYNLDPVPRHLSDIAVVRFAGGLPPGAQAALLADESAPFESGAEVAIAGYGVDNGFTETGGGTLRVARVKIQDAAYDASEFKIDASQGAGDCSGDSGGPAYLVAAGPLRVLGVDNWGEGFCDRFGIYARVSFFRAWIEQAIASLRSGSEQTQLIGHVPSLPVRKSWRPASSVHSIDE